jgi:uncharacterized repeat protein (TIGR01451 family)
MRRVAAAHRTISHVALYTCDPVNLTIDKSSTLVSDPTGAPGGPYHVPGAVVRYCILVSNPSTGTASNVAITDTLPANTSFNAGSMRSGTSCAGAATVEDDDAADGGEADPVTMASTGTVVTGTRGTLAAGASTAFVFTVTVN